MKTELLKFFSYCEYHCKSASSTFRHSLVTSGNCYRFAFGIVIAIHRR